MFRLPKRISPTMRSATNTPGPILWNADVQPSKTTPTSEFNANALRLSARRQPSAGAAWLAEPRFQLAYMVIAPLRCPFSILQRFCLLGRSAGRAVWPQRSGGQAASFGTGSENDCSELRSNSRARPRESEPRITCSTTIARNVTSQEVARVQA